MMETISRMSGMALTESDQHFRARFQQVQDTERTKNALVEVQDTERTKNALIEEVLVELEALREQYQTSIMDREREVFFNRESQQLRHKLEAENRRLRGVMERNPFVLVLLDGDGMIFQDYLLQRAEQGGREAAALLWTAVCDYLESSAGLSHSDCKIVVRIYANMKGLADACYKAGIVDSPSKIEEFARGFTRSKHLFDFTDVGGGKDRADDKLAEVFKLHLYNCNCRLILFGCSHDNGYARLLEDFATDPTSIERITMLEGYPFEREIGALRQHFRSIKFEKLFREMRITLPVPGQLASSDYSAQAQAQKQHLVHQLQLQQQQQQHQQQQQISMQQHQQQQQMQQTSQVQLQQHLALQRSATTPITSQGFAGSVSLSANPIPQSWALAATAAASPPTTPHPYSSGLVGSGSNTIPRNRKGQRVDAEFKYDRFDIKRVKAMKMCNVHYLRGDCPYGTDCTHEHNYKPTPTELASVRFIARQAPCRMLTECEDPKCIYGHRCPAGTPCAFGENCRFPPDMHYLDTVVVKSIKI